MSGDNTVPRLMRRYLSEVVPQLRQMDAGVKRVYDRSVGGDREGAWQGVIELAPTADQVHATLEPMATDLAVAGMRDTSVDALRAIAHGALAWSRLHLEIQQAIDEPDDSQELNDLFDQRLYDVYVEWRSAEDALHDAGDLVP